ncbi:hypothetical protein [Streptomyces goshikiensis]|uniref:hypothetical protein n=1 Tax=Streptomyces goshikiensis TaxID=1942 RepID=UPI0036C05858
MDPTPGFGRITLQQSSPVVRPRSALSAASSIRHFQDGCLTTFQKHLLQRYQILSPFYEHETAHGTWGPLPWWAIALHDEHERGPAEALLTRGGIQLSFTAKNHDADELLITCWEPGPGPSALTACLRFNLLNVIEC